MNRKIAEKSHETSSRSASWVHKCNSCELPPLQRSFFVENFRRILGISFESRYALYSKTVAGNKNDRNKYSFNRPINEYMASMSGDVNSNAGLPESRLNCGINDEEIKDQPKIDINAGYHSQSRAKKCPLACKPSITELGSKSTYHQAIQLKTRNISAALRKSEPEINLVIDIMNLISDYNQYNKDEKEPSDLQKHLITMDLLLSKIDLLFKHEKCKEDRVLIASLNLLRDEVTDEFQATHFQFHIEIDENLTRAKKMYKTDGYKIFILRAEKFYNSYKKMKLHYNLDMVSEDDLNEINNSKNKIEIIKNIYNDYLIDVIGGADPLNILLQASGLNAKKDREKIKDKIQQIDWSLDELKDLYDILSVFKRLLGFKGSIGMALNLFSMGSNIRYILKFNECFKKSKTGSHEIKAKKKIAGTTYKTYQMIAIFADHFQGDVELKKRTVAHELAHGLLSNLYLPLFHPELGSKTILEKFKTLVIDKNIDLDLFYIHNMRKKIGKKDASSISDKYAKYLSIEDGIEPLVTGYAHFHLEEDFAESASFFLGPEKYKKMLREGSPRRYNFFEELFNYLIQI
jgi:hypothetical protein